MTGHKLKEPAMDDMINVLHMSKVKHVNVMRVLKEQVGGQESMNITERDIQNRYIQNCWIIVWIAELDRHVWWYTSAGHAVNIIAELYSELLILSTNGWDAGGQSLLDLKPLTTSQSCRPSSTNAEETTHNSITSTNWTRTMWSRMFFGVMQASGPTTWVRNASNMVM